MSTRIVIDVPDRALFPLTDRAEESGMTVAEYVLAAGLLAAGVTEKRQNTIRRLWELGFTDAAMGNYLNTTNASIAQARRRLGLPANRHGRVNQRGNAA